MAFSPEHDPLNSRFIIRLMLVKENNDLYLSKMEITSKKASWLLGCLKVFKCFSIENVEVLQILNQDLKENFK